MDGLVESVPIATSNISDIIILYLLYDAPNIFKNIFNNWQRGEIHVFIFCSISMSANFRFMKDLYNLECGKPIKMAFKLNDRYLNPQAIEWVNVNLAASVFGESTINAMKVFLVKVR